MAGVERDVSIKETRERKAGDKTKRWLEADPTIPTRTKELKGAFHRFFNQESEQLSPNELLLTCAPGRVEGLGSHTDYNEGDTLSFNIRRTLLALGRPRTDNVFRIASLDEGGRVVTFTGGSVSELEGQKSPKGKEFWSNYVKGIVWGNEKAGRQVRGFDMVLQSTIPTGGGVSSSAALELATANFIAEANGHTLSPVDLGMLSKDAENNYVGAPCGYLDQMTEALADGEILYVSYRPSGGLPFSYEKVSADLKGHSFVVGYDPESKHDLASGPENPYAVRRRICEESVDVLKDLLGNNDISALSDLSPEQLERVRDQLQRRGGETMTNYVTHVVYEIGRVQRGKNVLPHGDVETYGQLMTESGKSAIELYGLAEGTPELSYLYRTILAEKEALGVAGIRNMGGGFTATTLGLTDDPERYKSEVDSAYQREFGRPYHFIESTPAPSAGVLDLSQVLKKAA